jgi:uncharacterized membrane protein
VNLFPWFLFAHVLGAVIAFGPTFSFPIIGRLGGQERIHANFATRLSYAISHVQVTPFAILQGITGVGLVITGNIDVLKAPWLIVGIVLYLIALSYAMFVQTPTVRRVIELTTVGGNGHSGSASRPSAPPAALDGVPPAGPGAGPGAGGPPPELMGLIRRIQMGGLLLAALIVAIVFLMVIKPSL